jgi:hypothetical protein
MARLLSSAGIDAQVSRHPSTICSRRLAGGHELDPVARLRITCAFWLEGCHAGRRPFRNRHMLSPAGIDGWFAEEDVTPTPACRGVDVQPRACSARRDATDSQRRARANGSHRGSFKVRGGYIRPLLRPASGTVSIRPARSDRSRFRKIGNILT